VNRTATGDGLYLYLAVSRARAAVRDGRRIEDAAAEAALYFGVDVAVVFDHARRAEKECAEKRAELRRLSQKRIAS
jgi:hypothetical protein